MTDKNEMVSEKPASDNEINKEKPKKKKKLKVSQIDEYEILGRDNLNTLPKKLLHIPIKMQCRAGGTGEARGPVQYILAPPIFHTFRHPCI